jgi:hypothetical protein
LPIQFMQRLYGAAGGMPSGFPGLVLVLVGVGAGSEGPSVEEVD